MGGVEFIVAIIAVCTLGSIANKWIAAKHGYDYVGDDGEKLVKSKPDQDPEMLKRIEKLEKRVRVLERITTDEGARLASEIEALQDAREDDLSDTLSTPSFKTREHS